MFNYNLEQAEKLKKEFNSWLGKTAHIGKGKTEILKAIEVKPKRDMNWKKKPLQTYMVEFHFENNQKFSAAEFLFYNGFN
jgi:hypothetical protein